MYYSRAIYWFKRDLRIEDNRALSEACKKSKEIIPIFIFIPQLLSRFKSYDERLGFVFECVKKLSEEVKKKRGKLFCYYDDPLNVFIKLIDKYKPEAVFTNRAFSWTGQEIEEKVRKLCNERGINFHGFDDNFLCRLTNIPYKKVYSHFYSKWKENLDLNISVSVDRIKIPKVDEPEINKLELPNIKPNSYWKVDFGRERLENFDFADYEFTRDRLDIDGTSRLSPFIRFGTVSLRKIYMIATEKAGDDCQFIKELAWREFWYHIKINFPKFYELEFQEKRRNLKWENNSSHIDAFINARTGYPIVDASIIQLKQEGWMHNRARMIVANFLTKDLLTDWRIGERFFMENLLDYDEVVNAGNWQWNASVGPDPKPLRIFNPVIQAKKFDPEALFIKKYLPELKNFKAFELHDPLSFKLKYYKPIVNHYERVLKIRELYQAKRIKDSQ